MATKTIPEYLKSSGKVKLRSRNDNDFTMRYAGIAKALASLPDETTVVVRLSRWMKMGNPDSIFS